MISKATTLISLLLFFTANAICCHAESQHVHHKVNVQIKPLVAMYLDDEDDVFGLFLSRVIIFPTPSLMHSGYQPRHHGSVMSRHFR